jgi:hypothetical protein
MTRAARRSSASLRLARRRGATPALRNADGTTPFNSIGMNRNQDAYWEAVRAAVAGCPPLCSSQRVLLRMIFAVPSAHECQYLARCEVSLDAA